MPPPAYLQDPIRNPVAAYLLRLVAGIVFSLSVRTLSWAAFLVALARRALRMPDLAAPRPAAFRVHASRDDASSTSDSDDTSRGGADQDLPAGGTATVRVYAPAAAAAKDPPGSPAKPATAKAAAAAPTAAAAGGGWFARRGARTDAEAPIREIEVLHVGVDPDNGTNTEAWRLVGPYLRKFGSHDLSFSTLCNPEFKHMVVPGVGTQAYVIGKAYWRTIVVAVGDPNAHRRDWAEIAATFLRAFPHATFAYASLDYAHLLHDKIKLVVTDMGAGTDIMVQTFNYTKRTRTIRNGARDARAAGVRVREVSPAGLTADVRRKMGEITEEWLGSKAVSDAVLRVFIRYFNHDTLQLEGGVRLFVAEAPRAAAPAAGMPSRAATLASEASLELSESRSVISRVGSAAPLARLGSVAVASSSAAALSDDDYEITGFVLIDPLHRDGAVYGYIPTINRIRRSAHRGTIKLMYDEVINTLRREDKEVLVLGVSSLFNVQTQPFCGPVWMELSVRFLYHFGTPLYQFKNLAFSKARYGGGVVGDAYADPNVRMPHVYCATRGTDLPSFGMLDNYVFFMTIGFCGRMSDTLLKLAGWRKGISREGLEVAD